MARRKKVKEVETGVWAWIKDKWHKFECWVYGWAPGLKTRAINALGVVGGMAASLQGYVTGLPVTKWITAETMALIVAGLFTLSYWFHGLGERVKAKE